jgi:hypothetical protein
MEECSSITRAAPLQTRQLVPQQPWLESPARKYTERPGVFRQNVAQVCLGTSQTDLTMTAMRWEEWGGWPGGPGNALALGSLCVDLRILHNAAGVIH